MWLCALTRAASARQVETLLGDPTRAKEKLGWTPTYMEELVSRNGASRSRGCEKEAYLKLKGFEVVGSMESPPMNSEVIKSAGGGA